MPTAPSKISESIVEQAALDWLSVLGYEILSGLEIAPGETAAERADYKQVFLFDRLQTKLKDLNPKIPLEGLQEALRKIRLISHPTLIENNRAFHRHLVEGVDAEFRRENPHPGPLPKGEGSRSSRPRGSGGQTTSTCRGSRRIFRARLGVWPSALWLFGGRRLRCSDRTRRGRRGRPIRGTRRRRGR